MRPGLLSVSYFGKEQLIDLEKNNKKSRINLDLSISK
jgi:hypothetical protein